MKEMKEITAINKGNSEEHYTIFINNEFFISCSLETIKQLKLKVGKLVDQEALLEIIEENDLKKAFNKALGSLSYKRRTEAELRSQLKDFDEAIIEKTMDKLRSYSFVDDDAYGEDYVVNQANQLKGRFLIERSLAQKGLEQEIIENSLTRLTIEDELANAEELAYDYFHSKKKLPYNQVKQKLSQKLLSKGYSWDIIRQALVFLDNNEELQEEIQQQQGEYLRQALEAAEKLHSKYSKKEINKYQLRAKIQGALYQKGFEEDIIRKAIEALE